MKNSKNIFFVIFFKKKSIKGYKINNKKKIIFFLHTQVVYRLRKHSFFLRKHSFFFCGSSALLAEAVCHIQQ